jgi:mannose-1-phosphate guanylyltransferase
MQALLLAGGLGTRLRPLTLTRPKHLLPVANRPHIERVMELLRRHGVTDVLLLTSYLADSFKGIADTMASRGVNVSVAHEQEPLGTAGALKNAESLLNDETFIVFNGDILTDADISALVKFHRKRGAEATILLTPVEDPSPFGVVPTDPGGRVLEFIEKPDRKSAPTNEINAGVYVLEPSILDRIPAATVFSAEHELFPALVADRAPLYATASDAYWVDIGTPRKFLQANIDALNGRIALESLDVSEGVLVDPDGEVADGADVKNVCVAEGAVIEKGAYVRDTVLLSGARIETGARVSRCILGEGARVVAGANVRDDVLADKEVAGES